MSECDTKSTEIQRLNNNGNTTLKIGYYCHYIQNQHDQILCKIIKFTSKYQCLIIDFINMDEYIVYKKHLSIIQDDTILNKVDTLNKKYLSIAKHKQTNENENNNGHALTGRIRKNINATWVLTFLCLLLSILSIICFYRSTRYFDELKEYRRSTTTQCNITNYTATQCQYDCNINDNIEICNGTQYTYYAIAKDVCDGELLHEAKRYALCPEKQIIGIDSIQTCFVIDCIDGFHFFPPFEHVDIDFAGLIWMLVGYFIGCIGAFCGLYACGEYVQGLGTSDLEMHNAPSKHHKCCKRNYNKLQTVNSIE